MTMIPLTWTKTPFNKLLMSKFTSEMVILNIKWKDCKPCKNLCIKNFTCTKKFYVYEIEIVAVNLSKTYFLKNAKKTCKPNNRDLNRDWIKVH